MRSLDLNPASVTVRSAVPGGMKTTAGTASLRLTAAFTAGTIPVGASAVPAAPRRRPTGAKASVSTRSKQFERAPTSAVIHFSLVTTLPPWGHKRHAEAVNLLRR